MLTVAQAARNRPDDDLPVLRFHSLRPAHPAAASRWVQTVTYITDSVRSNPDGMAGPLLSEASARLLAAALLTTFPNSWTIETHHQDRTDANPTTLPFSGLQLALMAIAGLAALLGGMALRRGVLRSQRAGIVP